MKTSAQTATTAPLSNSITQDTINQAPRESTQFRPGPSYRKIGPRVRAEGVETGGVGTTDTATSTENQTPSDWKNFHGSYFVAYSGPRLAGETVETYNVFLGDVGPQQYFHAIKFWYTFSDGIDFGVSGSAVHNITGPIVSPYTGFVYDRSFVFFDPGISIGLPRLIQIQGWSINTTLGANFPITESSKQVNRIIAFTIAQSWSVDLNPSNWSFGFSFFANPHFFSGDPPTFGYRQTFSANGGLNLGYRVSPLVALQASTTFDFDHREPNPNGVFHFTPNLEDRGRFSMAITPNVAPYNFSLGLFLQYLLNRPSGETSTIGFDVSVGF